jgi:hypothetical protein
VAGVVLEDITELVAVLVYAVTEELAVFVEDISVVVAVVG